MTATDSQTSLRTDVLVIGAGQAGLSAGYHLRQRGIDHRIVEADDRIGDVWRRRFDSLRLYSPARIDALPGMPFPLPKADYPTGRQMADYLESYAARFTLPVDTGVRIDGLDAPAIAGQPVVATGAGRRYEAGSVVVATGPFQRPRVPAFAADLHPRIRQIHSGDYRNPSQLADGPVLVVGLSHSGSDLAHEFAATHEVIVSGQARGQFPVSVNSRAARFGWPVVAFIEEHLTLDTPIGRKMAPKVRKGGAPLVRWRKKDLRAAGVELTEARTAGAQDGKPLLADGRVLDVANVVWCTGFEADYSWIQPPIDVDDSGTPVQYRGVSKVPGLFFVGLLFQYSFTSMLVHGAGPDAEYVVDRIAERQKAGTAQAGAPEPARAAADFAR